MNPFRKLAVAVAAVLALGAATAYAAVTTKFVPSAARATATPPVTHCTLSSDGVRTCLSSHTAGRVTITKRVVVARGKTTTVEIRVLHANTAVTTTVTTTVATKHRVVKTVVVDGGGKVTTTVTVKLDGKLVTHKVSVSKSS
jgi:hypothetical protein